MQNLINLTVVLTLATSVIGCSGGSSGGGHPVPANPDGPTSTFTLNPLTEEGNLFHVKGKVESKLGGSPEPLKIYVVVNGNLQSGGNQMVGSFDLPASAPNKESVQIAVYTQADVALVTTQSVVGLAGFEGDGTPPFTRDFGTRD